MAKIINLKKHSKVVHAKQKLRHALNVWRWLQLLQLAICLYLLYKAV